MSKINSYYSRNELKKLGLKKFGKNILISRNTKIYDPEKLSLENNVRIDDFCILTGNIVLGNYVHISPFCLLSGRYNISMKDFSGLSSRVSIYTSNEDYVKGSSLTNPTIPEKIRNIESGSVLIEQHAVVGASSILLPNTHLETGVILGAYSLAKGKFEKWKIYVGIPAKFKKNRPRTTIEKDGKKLLEKLMNFKKPSMNLKK